MTSPLDYISEEEYDLWQKRRKRESQIQSQLGGKRYSQPSEYDATPQPGAWQLAQMGNLQGALPQGQVGYIPPRPVQPVPQPMPPMQPSPLSIKGGQPLGMERTAQPFRQAQQQQGWDLSSESFRPPTPFQMAQQSQTPPLAVKSGLPRGMFQTAEQQQQELDPYAQAGRQAVAKELEIANLPFEVAASATVGPLAGFATPEQSSQVGLLGLAKNLAQKGPVEGVQEAGRYWREDVGEALPGMKGLAEGMIPAGPSEVKAGIQAAKQIPRLGKEAAGLYFQKTAKVPIGLSVEDVSRKPYAQFVQDIGNIQRQAERIIEPGGEWYLPPTAGRKIVERAIRAADEGVISQQELYGVIDEFYPAEKQLDKPQEIVDYFKGKLKLSGVPEPRQMTEAEFNELMGDLTRKSDQPTGAIQAEREAARASFQEKWAKAYGNEPETVPIVKPEPVVTPQPELTMGEARKVAKMSDAELAEYNAGKQAPTPQATREPWEMTASDIEARYPNAGAAVDGRTVGKTVKNQSSIEASIDNPTVLKGIREVPISAFEDSGPPKFYSSSEEARTRQLAEQIQQSGHIDPLIVVDDAQGSPYILEGGHRFDALKILGAKSFPAQVVVDEDAYYKAAKEALASGKPVPPEVLADYPDLAASQTPIKQIAPEPLLSTPAERAGAGESLGIPVPKEPAPILYHGTKADFIDTDIATGKKMFGIHLTTDPDAAKEYGKVKAYALDSNAKILDLSDGDNLWEFMSRQGILDEDDLVNVDLENYVRSGQLYQYDISSRTHLADDVARTVLDLGYDVLKMPDNLRGLGDDIAWVVVNPKALRLPETARAPMRTFAGDLGESAEQLSKQVEARKVERSLPPMEDNYLKPLSRYADTFYRETSVANAIQFIPGGELGNATLPEVFLANTPDMALGQGKNKGVLLTFKAGSLQGQVNRTKPGWQVAYDSGQAEFISKYNNRHAYVDALESVTIKNDAQGSRADIKRAQDLVKGWDKTINPDGSVTYRKPSNLPTAAPIQEPLTKPPAIKGKGEKVEQPKARDAAETVAGEGAEQGVQQVQGDEAGPPRVPPTEPPRTTEPPIEPTPPARGQLLPRIPANAEIEARIDRPGKLHTVGQTLAKIPGGKGVVGAVDPWIAQASHVERIPLMLRAMEDMGSNIVRDAMTRLEAIPLKGFTIKDNKFVEGVRPKAGYEDASLALSDVLEHSYRYDMPDDLRKFIRTANQLNDDLVKWANEEGVKFKQIKFEPGGHYFGRIVREVREVAKRTRARPDLPRAYDSMEAGIATGVKYEDDLLATANAGYDWLIRKIIGKRMAKELAVLGRTPKELMEPGVLTGAIDAARQLRAVSAYERTLKAVRDGMSPLYEVKRPNAREGMDLREQFLAMDKIKPGTAMKIMDIAQMEKGAQRTANINELLTEAAQWRKEMGKAYQGAKAKRAKGMERTRASEFAEGTRFGLPEGTIGVGPIKQGFAQGRLFPRETADYLNQAFAREQSKTLKGLGSINDAIRTIKTGFDLGTVNIQLLPTMVAHPKAWSKATFYMFKGIADPSAYAAYMARPENQEVLQKLIPHGLSIEGLEYGAGLERQSLLGKVLPEAVRGRMQMAFLAPINVGKVEIAKGLVSLAERKGELDGLAMFLNNVTGTRSSLGAGLGPRQRAAESTLGFFSPRMTRSSLALVGDAVQGGIKGQEARKALAGLVTANLLIAGGLRAALGQPITPEFFDPTSPEFMTAELFGRRVGLGGPHRAIVSLIGQSVKTAQNDPERFIDPLDRRENPITRWWTGRTTPVTSMLWDMTERKDFLGSPLQTPEQWASWLAEKPAPMWAQEYVPGPGKQMPELAGLAPDVTGMRAIPLTPAQQRDKAIGEAMKGTGKSLKELSTVERWELGKKKPEIEELAKEAVGIYAERGSAYHEYKQTLDTLRDEKEGQIKELGRELNAGKISGNEYRERVSERERDIAQLPETIQAANPRFQEAKAEIEAGRVEEQKTVPELDRYLDEYYQITKDLIDESTGTLDVEELLRRRKELKVRYPEDVVQRATAYVNRNREPEYVKALDLFSRYMDIPKYIGMSEDNARKADEIGRYIREMSRQSGSTARARIAAIKKYRNEYALYSRAQSRGVNVKRKIFWRKNPLLSKYFSDVPLEPQMMAEAS